MKKAMLSLIVLMMTMSIPFSDLWAACTVTETKVKSLPIAGDVTATTSFSLQVGDTCTITISGTSATITGVTKRNVTPRGDVVISTGGNTGTSINVTLVSATGGAKTAHLDLNLSTGEKIGVNLHIQ